MTFKNAGNAVHGAVALPQALQVSSDVFFYRLGLEMNGARRRPPAPEVGQPLRPRPRDRASTCRRSCPACVPTPEWRNRLFKKKLTDRPWSSGDNVNLSVGQGDLQANPLQMAVAYARDRQRRPHRAPAPRRPGRGHRGPRDPGVRSAPARRKLNITPANRQAILDGLRQAAERAGRHLDTASSRASRSRSPARPAPRRRGAAAPTSPGTSRSRPYPNPRYVVVATFERAASAPRPPPRRPAGSSPRSST